MSSLKKLKELTEKLPILSKDSFVKTYNSSIEYNMERGNCKGTALVYSDVCAVQYCSMEANSLFPVHAHQEIEILVITKGAGEHITGDGCKPLSTGDTIVCRPGIPHAFRSVTYMELVGITIPSSEGYPRVK